MVFGIIAFDAALPAHDQPRCEDDNKNHDKTINVVALLFRFLFYFFLLFFFYLNSCKYSFFCDLGNLKVLRCLNKVNVHPSCETELGVSASANA
jgi:hypothetical protein